MSNSDSLPAVHHFALLIGFLFTKKKISSAGEGLSSSELYYRYMSLPIYRRILRCSFQVLHIFHGLHPYTQGSTSSFPLKKKSPFLTIRQNSLYVTTCIFTSILANTLPSRFRPNISITPGDWLLGSLAIT